MLGSLPGVILRGEAKDVEFFWLKMKCLAKHLIPYVQGGAIQ